MCACHWVFVSNYCIALHDFMQAVKWKQMLCGGYTGPLQLKEAPLQSLVAEVHVYNTTLYTESKLISSWTGSATRKCLSGALWATPNVSFCGDKRIAEIGDMVRDFMSSLASRLSFLHYNSCNTFNFKNNKKQSIFTITVPYSYFPKVIGSNNHWKIVVITSCIRPQNCFLNLTYDLVKPWWLLVNS